MTIQLFLPFNQVFVKTETAISLLSDNNVFTYVFT